MIKIIGTKIVFMILALALANGALAYGVYDYLIPLQAQKRQELETLKAETQARYQEVASLKEQFGILQNQLRDFKVLEAKGYFGNQNRVEAQESFERLRQLSGLLKARYSMSKGELIDDPKALEANHVVLKTAVKLDIDSLDDVDVYTFVKALEEKFPGSVDVTAFSLERNENITAPLLRRIGAGDPVRLVSSVIEFDWRTMSNKDRLDEFDAAVSSSEPESMLPVTTPNAPPAGQPVAPQPQPVAPAVQP